MLRHTFRSAIVLVAMAIGTTASPQDGSFKSRFRKASQEGDFAEQQTILDQWAAASANDAEMYVAYFNYYVNLGHDDGIRIGKDPKGGPVLQILDQDTSNKAPVGYLYGENSFEPALVDSGLAYIDLGIAKFPQRLDMRFGKVYMFGQLEDYDRFTDEIVRTVAVGDSLHYQWTWEDNVPVEDPEAYMLDIVQQYVYQLFETGDDSLLKDMERISLAVLKHHPDHVESLSSVATVHLLHQEYDKALELLLRAEKLAPNDGIVTGNIAEAYKRMGDKANAIAYYERTLAVGDEEAKDNAKRQLELLRK